VRLSPVVGVTLLIAAFGASSAQAAFNCSASAGRLTVFGQKVEPVTANSGAAECVGETKTLTGPAAGLPAPVSAAAVVAATEFYPAQKAIVASGGVADLRIGSLPTLPIQLPQVTIPDSLKTVSVSLAAVKALNPAVLGPLPASIDVDVSAAVQALLPNGQLPTAELLRVQNVVAYAAGSCLGGAAAVSGSSQVAGISVLGTDLPLGTLIDQAVPLIDSANVDPSSVSPSSITVPLPPAAQTAANLAITLGAPVTATLNAAIQSALDALPTISIPATAARVTVVPGLKVQDATSVTQQALNIIVSIAGQTVVDAVIGEAQASSAGVDCSVPVTDPGTPTGATLQCSTRRLVLVDVLERGHRVKLTGVADPSLAGKSVAIVFNATGKVVAHAKVNPDGSFDTTAPLPPRRLRDTNDARYMATLGKEESINLKLRRRMILRSMTSANGKVTITGRVIPPLDKPLEAITLKRRVSCDKEAVVTRFKPRKSGFFRITVKAPKGVGTAVYRMTTKVRVHPNGSGLFDTYTLPRAVDLQR
jgi:hypothetical protein